MIIDGWTGITDHGGGHCGLALGRTPDLGAAAAAAPARRACPDQIEGERGGQQQA